MMDQAGVLKASICLMAVSVAFTVGAQENVVPAAVEPAAAATAEQPAKPFDPLVRLMNVRGPCEVKNPDVGQFAPVQDGKAYPLGTTVRTGPGGTAFILFSTQESVQVLESSEVVVSAPEGAADARQVTLVSGRIKTSLRDTLPEGCFAVLSPNASCKNMSGRGDFSLKADTTAETFQAATITGSARVEGPHYVIPALRAANTVHIQTALDRSFSRLTSASGDFAILLENGTETPVNYGMSPKAVVKIWRENAPVGGRPIIATLVVSPTGMARHRFAYAVGRPTLATGELIAAQTAEEADLPVLLTKPAEQADKPAEPQVPETP